MAPLTRHLNPSHALPIDSQFFQALAGPSSVPFPPLHSIVYYFPHGHSDNSDHVRTTPLPISPRLKSTLFIRCRILSVHHFFRSDTEEIFIKLRLKPIRAGDDVDERDQAREEVVRGAVRYFAKVLTSSDANNGGGFSMPKAFAELFPKLDLSADPPVQNLNMFDMQGKVWEFRHIFRGKPLRNLFTTGWSKFVNAKNLIQGDSVVFIRDERSNSLHIGVRRGNIYNDDEGNNVLPWADMNVIFGVNLEAPEEMEVDFGNSFSRKDLGKVPKEEVIEAAEKALTGEEFETVYYPGGGFGNFVVKAELVERALKCPWRLGVRVKLNLVNEESSKSVMVKGTVVALYGYDKIGLWDAKSPWQMLKIHWDDPKLKKEDEWLSPWELQIDTPLEDALFIQPGLTQITPEAMSNIAAAPPRFNTNLSQNSRVSGLGGNGPATNVLNLGSMVQVEVPNGDVDVAAEQNESMNSAPAIQENNAHNIGTFKLFGKIIYYEMKPDGNGST